MTIKIVMSCYVPDGSKEHPRAQYARLSTLSLRDHLKSPEAFSFIAANDGPKEQPFVSPLLTLMWEWNASCSGGERKGIGGSLNRALELVGQNDLWLYTTDDWRLTENLDLTQAVKLIREVGYDYVRLGPPRPNIQATVKFQQYVGWWLELDQSWGGFVFATRPFLATKSFYQNVGPFREQCDSYVCERDYSDRVNSEALMQPHIKMGEVICGSLEGPWEHVGEVSVGDKFP